MKLSTRNQLKGEITNIKTGPVSTEVTVNKLLVKRWYLQ